MDKEKSAFKKAISSRWFIYSVILFCTGLFFAWQLSNLLIKAHRDPAGPGRGPEMFSIPYEKGTIKTADGQLLHTWFLKGKNGKAVILCHGVGADKSQMVTYAVFLYKAGYSVLMFDFRGHGENKESFISIGFIEVKDLEAAVAWLNELGYENPGVLGISMGASVALRTAAKDNNFGAVVADSPFATLNGMMAYRAKGMGLPYWPAVPAVKTLAKLRTGYNFNEVNPVEDVKNIRCPVFIIHGLLDNNIPVENGKEIFAAANEPKELLLVSNAGHVDSHGTVQKEYERKVLDFFSKYLK